MFWTKAKRILPIIIVVDMLVNHWMGYIKVIIVLASGGTYYFTLKTNLSMFVKDIQIVRPIFI